jgi:nitrogenase molybdenum-iron protein NifN
MPLGGVIAFKGIEGSMVIIHGSQGCSTYMRLHNVMHFNEPVDIASSSLNEKQTIFGGEENLIKGLDNVIRVYQPKVVGLLTTCLSETIGEDITRIAGDYVRKKGITDVDIIPVPTPSYDGSHTEGFWAVVRGVVERYARPAVRHGKINVIVPHISPADIREIKRILELMGMEYTLLPDHSRTLDRPYGEPFTRIPAGGTHIADIVRMGGAPATIQFGLTCEETGSAGHYLEKEFGVPLYNLPLPIGIEAADRFIEALGGIGGNAIPATLKDERGWLQDAMADSHKFNMMGKPIIYGEPELVQGVTRVCLENGAFPAVLATGGRSKRLAELLIPEFMKEELEVCLMDEADFSQILDKAKELGANIAVGHSGGKFLTEKGGIPVVRVGFPIHDRVGGQRILTVGYAGTIRFLDQFTNTLLETTFNNYRRLRYEELYEGTAIDKNLHDGVAGGKEKRAVNGWPFHNGSGCVNVES